MRLFLPMLSLLFLGGASATETWAQSAQDSKPCISCHLQIDAIPAIYGQYRQSRHYENDVTCEDCHGAERNDPDAFEHEGHMISLIVTPDDCGKCHAQALQEFNASDHRNARRLVTTGVGRYFLQDLAALPNLAPGGKYSLKPSACYGCHGSEIEVGENGRPLPETWPNSGIGRVNPDGSVGYCGSCHEPHGFSIAQARRPESCGICHNSAGGDPQYEAFNSSRHGLNFRAQAEKMDLDADPWIAGQDYVIGATCATCHMSAIADGIPATHDINQRVGWSRMLQLSNTLAVEEKCGPLIEDTGYAQGPHESARPDLMEKVCRACHSGTLVSNFTTQYEQDVRLFMRKWITPGKELFRLASEVFKANEKDSYRLFNHPIDFTWWAMCNTDAKNIHVGASMMSPGQIEAGVGGFIANWHSAFIPEIESIISSHSEAADERVQAAVSALRNYLDTKVQARSVRPGAATDPTSARASGRAPAGHPAH
jgi:hypothetical protein